MSIFVTMCLTRISTTICARELTRVATPATENAWVEDARGKTVREIEERVAGHRPGDLPDDPADPALVTQTVVLELDGAAFAAWREARTVLERGPRFDHRRRRQSL